MWKEKKGKLKSICMVWQSSSRKRKISNEWSITEGHYPFHLKVLVSELFNKHPEIKKLKLKKAQFSWRFGHDITFPNRDEDWCYLLKSYFIFGNKNTPFLIFMNETDRIIVKDGIHLNSVVNKPIGGFPVFSSPQKTTYSNLILILNDKRRNLWVDGYTTMKSLFSYLFIFIRSPLE